MESALQHVYWTIGGISAAGASLLAIIWGLTNRNSNKISSHDVLFAKLESMPDSVEKLTKKVDQLMIHVAVIRNSCMYVPHNGPKENR